MDIVFPNEILDIIFKDITDEEAFRFRIVCKYFLKKFDHAADKLITYYTIWRYCSEVKYLFNAEERDKYGVHNIPDLYLFRRRWFNDCKFKQIMQINAHTNFKFTNNDKFRIKGGDCYIFDKLIINGKKKYFLEWITKKRIRRTQKISGAYCIRKARDIKHVFMLDEQTLLNARKLKN